MVVDDVDDDDSAARAGDVDNCFSTIRQKKIMRFEIGDKPVVVFQLFVAKTTTKKRIFKFQCVN